MCGNLSILVLLNLWNFQRSRWSNVYVSNINQFIGGVPLWIGKRTYPLGNPSTYQLLMPYKYCIVRRERDIGHWWDSMTECTLQPHLGHAFLHQFPRLGCTLWVPIQSRENIWIFEEGEDRWILVKNEIGGNQTIWTNVWFVALTKSDRMRCLSALDRRPSIFGRSCATVHDIYLRGWYSSASQSPL